MHTLRRIAAVFSFLLPSIVHSLEFQVQPLIVPSHGKIGFSRMQPTSTGLDFINELSDDRASTNRNFLSGSGVAAADIDGDNHIDLFFCALDNPNVLYRNRGNWTFENITHTTPAIAMPDLDCTGAVFADIDRDGDSDLLVNALGRGTHLFLNDGKGIFSLRTDSGLQTNTGSTSMALADIDADGDLDLYVTNFRPTTVRDDPTTRFTIAYDKNRPFVQKVNGRPATAPDLTNRFIVTPGGSVAEQGELDALYENDGTGRFSLIPFDSGRFREYDGSPLKEMPFDWGLAVQMRDFSGDGAPDIYVCNDYWTPDRIWINDGKGSFRAAAPHSFRSTSYSSMGADFADINRDGYFDLFVVDMLARSHRDQQAQVAEIPMFYSPPGEIDSRFQIAQNTLQLNRGDGTFAQIANFSGLQASEWSWNATFIDVDLDGWEDLLVSNGHRRDFQSADATLAIQQALTSKKITFKDRRAILEMFPPQTAATAAFRNQGDLTFQDVSKAWGFSEPAISHGSCLADLDNDGDLDFIVNNLGSPCGIYRNETTAGRVAIRFVSGGKNAPIAGARLVLRTPSLSQSQEVIIGGRYLSSDFPERVFALPTDQTAVLELHWPNHRSEVIQNIKANSRYLVFHP